MPYNAANILIELKKYTFYFTLFRFLASKLKVRKTVILFLWFSHTIYFLIKTWHEKIIVMIINVAQYYNSICSYNTLHFYLKDTIKVKKRIIYYRDT